MRKHVLALLSIFGLAGSSTPASAQVVKGSQAADTKSESTVKASKAAQESAAGQGTANITVRKAGGEQNANKQDSSKKVLIGLSQPAKDDAAKKMRKAGGEQNASKQDSSKKVLVGLSQPAKDDAAAKMRKAGGEQQAETSAQAKKDAKSNAGFADGSVRTSGSGGGAGKVAMHDIHVKSQKNTAEVNAGQLDANKKAQKQSVQPSAQKQVDKASPK
jgi:prepilin-type processing-associated H-X9-DG protein